MKNYGLTEQEAVDGAIVLSKKMKSEVVVYSNENGFGYEYYGDFFFPDSFVTICFNNGEESDFPFYQS
jgi:hypothetical protein